MFVTSRPEYYRLTVEPFFGEKKHFSSRDIDQFTLISNRKDAGIKGITLALTGHKLTYERMDEMLNRLFERRKEIPVEFMELEYLRICETKPDAFDPRYERQLIEGNQFDPHQGLDDDLMEEEEEDEPAQKETDLLAVLDTSKEEQVFWQYEQTTLEYICQLCELLRVSIQKIYFPASKAENANIFVFPSDYSSLAHELEWHKFFNWLAGEKQRVDRDIQTIEKEEQEYRHNALVALNIAAAQQTRQKIEELKKREEQKNLKSFLWNGPTEKKSCTIL